MRIKKFTKKDKEGNTVSLEFDVPPMQEIPHPGEPKGTDTVPAWLTPGEFVVNAEATRMFEPQIEAMNNVGRQIQKAQGGSIPTYAADGGKINLKEEAKFLLQNFPERAVQTLMHNGNISRKEAEKIINSVRFEVNDVPKYAAEGDIAMPLPRPEAPKDIAPVSPQKIYSMLVDRGFSDVAAKGILGNMFQESKFDPDVYQKLDNDSIGKGRGLLQWETGGRFDTDPLNLLDFANKQEKSWKDPEVQLDFMIAEMDKSAGLTPESAERQNYQYDMARTKMNQANTPEEAAEIFSNLYLKPGKPHLDTRMAYASEFEPRTTQVAQTDVPPVMQEVPKEEGNFLTRMFAGYFGGEEPSTEINMDFVFEDDNKAAMKNTEKYLFMGDLIKAGGNIIENIKQGPAEPTPEVNVPDEYKVIEQLREKGYTPEQVAAILRGEDVPVIQEPVEPVFKDVPQYTGQGAVGESMMGTKPGSLVSGMPQEDKDVDMIVDTKEVPASAVAPSALDDINVVPVDQMVGMPAVPKTPEDKNEVPEVVDVPKPDSGAEMYRPSGFGATIDEAKVPQIGEAKIKNTKSALERAKEVFAKTDVDDPMYETRLNNIKNLEQQLKEDESKMAIKKMVESDKENLEKANEEAATRNKVRDLEARKTGDPSIDSIIQEQIDEVEKTLPKEEAPKPEADPKPDAKDDKKNEALGGAGAFKDLTNTEQEGFDKVTQVKEEDIPEGMLEKATSTLKGIFGDLFDPQELGRMGVIFAASRLMGYDSGPALQFAAKGYLKRVDAKIASRNKFVTSEAALKRFTPESLQEYKKTGDMKKLVQKPVAGKPIKPTGEMQTFYPVGGGKPVKAAKVTQDGRTFYVTGDGKVVNQFAFHTDPAKVPGTDEYKKKVSESGDTYTGYLAELEKNAGEKNKIGINTGVNGRNIAEWQVKHDVPSEVMGRIVDMAYRSAAAEGKQINNIVPYLESAYITATVGDATLFTTKDGKPASSEKILDAVDMGVALVRQNPAAEGKSSEQIKNDMLALMRQKYDTLTADERAIYNEEAGDDESGFLTFMLEQIEEAQGKALGVY
jgi:hypothetical protein